MKLNFLKIGFYATMFAMTLFVVSCGSGEHDHNHDGHDHQHQGQEQQEHNHNHESQQTEQSGQQESSIDKTGKEYTSAYICPMHCEGSGSETAGKCPKCKMDYIANADVKK